MAKLKTIYVAELQWSRPEWADDPDSEAETAEAAGYVFELAPSTERQHKFDWSVRATAAISETPDVIGSGTAASRKGAIWAAGLAANRDQKLRAKGQALVQPVSVVQPATAPEMTAGAMLEAVEDQVDAAVEAKPKRTRKPAEEPTVNA